MQLKSFLISTFLLALTMPLNVLGKGRVSFYYPAPSKAQPPSCGSESQYLVEYYVALNRQQLDQNKSYYCGKCVQIIYKNKYLVGKIVDRCPGCGNQGLDISPAMFTHFEDEDTGIFYTDWKIVSCDLYGKKGVCPDSSCNISGSSSAPKPKTTTQAPPPKPKSTTQAPPPKPTTQAPPPKPTTQAPQPKPNVATQAPQPKPAPVQAPSSKTVKQFVPQSTTSTTTTQQSNTTTQQNNTTTNQQNTTTSVDGTTSTAATENATSQAANPDTTATAGTNSTPVLNDTRGNSNTEVNEVLNDDKDGNGNYIIPITGVVMVSCAAGAGLIYLTKSKKYETFPDALKGLKRSFTNGSSIRRNITRSYSKRKDVLPTTNKNETTNTEGHVINVNNEPSSEMDISESRVTFNL
jgi:hypothetical protein